MPSPTTGSETTDPGTSAVLPTQAGQDYIAQNPDMLANGGQREDDDNVVDLAASSRPSRPTPARSRYIIMHSLGVPSCAG